MDNVNHVDEELLERYSLGRIGEDEAAPVEEHLRSSARSAWISWKV